jgi:hypothetical protein
MREREGISEVAENSLGPTRGTAAIAGEQIAQAFARDVLHHEVQKAGRLARCVHGDDVRMAEVRHDPRFLQESLPVARRDVDVRRDDLDRHRAVQRTIASERDHPHAAMAEHALDLILRAERLAKLVELVGLFH